MNQVGRYKILEEIGRGATGIVYKALDPAIGRTVAIKTIDLGELSNADERQRVRERLLREAQSAGLLSHPNIVTIYDVLEKEDYAYIFMEYVNGSSLENMLRTGSLPDNAALLQFLRQVADALDYAHRKGIVHRDIKPANILIAAATPHSEPLAKIADFGVAKFVSHEMTHSGTMIGTPNYMSPEQIQGLTVDGRSDQFSLAVIVYELLTGVKPFAGDSLPALFYQICKQDPKPVEQANASLNETVGKVLHRALAKSADERFASCVAFVGALTIALGDSPAWAYVPRAVAVPAGAMDETSGGVNIVRAAEPPVRTPTAQPNEPTRVRKTEPEAAPVAAASAAAVSEIPDLPALTRRRREEEAVELEETPQRSSFPKKLALIAAMCVAIVGAIVFIVHWNSPSVPTQVLDTSSAPMAPPPDVSEPGGQAQVTSGAAKSNAQRRAAPLTRPARTQTTPTMRPATRREAAQAPQLDNAPAGGRSDVEFLTEPAGAQITIDGNGATSCTAPCDITLPAGRHTMSAQLGGYEIARRIFNVPGDSSLFLPLAKNTGALVVTSVPSGAIVLVDGQEVGHTPMTVHLGMGIHRIAWVYGGNQHQETVDIQSGIQARGFRFQ